MIEEPSAADVKKTCTDTALVITRVAPLYLGFLAQLESGAEWRAELVREPLLDLVRVVSLAVRLAEEVEERYSLAGGDLKPLDDPRFALPLLNRLNASLALLALAVTREEAQAEPLLSLESLEYELASLADWLALYAQAPPGTVG